MGQILDEIRRRLEGWPKPEVGTSLTRAHTGRVTDSFSQEELLCETLIQQWLDDPSGGMDSLGRRLFAELISELPRCPAPATYRARAFGVTDSTPDPFEFGPPPCPGVGRYNCEGQRTLYLGTDTDGLRAEMARYEDDRTQFLYGRYGPVESLSLVDASSPKAHPAIQHAFDRAERVGSDYEAGQRIADVMRELGVDGMIVPGVRGSVHHRYQNVVVFNCDSWRDWIDTGFTPTAL